MTGMQRDGEWTFRRGLEIYGPGGMAWLENEDEAYQHAGINVRNVTWPNGNNRPSQVL